MSDTPQNYANHKMFDKVFIGAALIVFTSIVLAVIASIMLAQTYGIAVSLALLSQILLGVGVLIVQIRARQYGTKVQDRVIHTEFYLRLKELGLGDKFDKLSMKQIIGLRFESDANLPALIDEVLEKNINSADAIKKMVKDWQADNARI